MNKLKKIFFEMNLTWTKVIIYAIVCGIVTGIIPLVGVLKETSIHNVAVCFEMWVFLAMFIILNSKKPFEAGLKTFVFFLISQPLCYLVQVPFYAYGFKIFSYYIYWAKLTVLTFPGAILAWYVKKENIFSMLILALAMLLLDGELILHFNTLLSSFPHQLLACLFIIFEIVFFSFIIFKEKKKKIIMLFLSIVILLPAYIAVKPSMQVVETANDTAIIVLDEKDNYTLVSADNGLSDIKIDEESVTVNVDKVGEYKITIQNSKGEFIELLVSYNKETGASIDYANKSEE